MKNLIWIVLAVIVLGGGYMLFTGKSVDEVVQDVSGAAQEVEAPEALEDATEAAGETAESASDAAGDAVEAAQETATEAAEAAADTMSDAAEVVESGATEAVEAAQDAAFEAVDAATGTADEAADAAADTAADDAAEAGNAAENAVEEAVEEAVDGATDAATGDMATEAELPAAAGDTPEALTVDGFDMERVRSLIEGSDLGSMQENLLIEGIRAAQDNPELLQSALQAARQALGY